MIEFIVKSTLCMGVSLILYYILLKPDCNFTFNRFYLLVTLFLALTVPVLNFSTTHTVPILNKLKVESIYDYNSEIEKYTEEEAIVLSDTPQFPVQTFLWSVYLLGTLVMAIRFLFNLYRIIRSIKSGKTITNDFYLVLLSNHSNPYSFFKHIFINKNDYQDKEYFNTLFEHEKAHSKQLHTIDIIAIELIKCFLWFNPLIWIYKNLISENHEYIADSMAVENGFSKEKYLNQIIHSSNNYTNKSILISGFSFKNTKNRILMLNKTKNSSRRKRFKLALIIVLVGTFFTLNSFKTNSSNPFLVVVDAGHGGKDNGAKLNNINEKDINLSVSSKLADIVGQNNIKIVLLRNEDKFISLETKVKAINKLKPDLVLSIHCNYAKNTSLNGTEVYYSSKKGFRNQSYNFSKTIYSNFSEKVSVNSKIKTASFYIFENSECPAILFQVGFISNSNDLSLLNDVSYQDRIAYSIYQSLEKISNNF
jgi:N-acetylmuramoyl-L-alanine amidase